MGPRSSTSSTNPVESEFGGDWSLVFCDSWGHSTKFIWRMQSLGHASPPSQGWRAGSPGGNRSVPRPPPPNTHSLKCAT